MSRFLVSSFNLRYKISSGFASTSTKPSGCKPSKTHFGKPGKKPEGVLIVQCVSTITLADSDFSLIFIPALF